jgi:hypothetical protein
MTRMFLTRLTELACAVIEVASIVFNMIKLTIIATKQLLRFSSKLAITLFPQSKFLQASSNQSSFLPEIKATSLEISRLITGLASTVFIGVIFSPETNFKIHLKLELAIDNLAEKTQRKLAAKLRSELQKAEIIKARTERLAKLNVEQLETKQAEIEANSVDSRLAELLAPLAFKKYRGNKPRFGS